MSEQKTPFSLRARRLARAEAQALMGQLEALEVEMKGASFKLNRRIRLLATASEDYEFKIRMLGREQPSRVEYMASRYREEIEKNKQERQRLEEVADQVRVLLRENDILKKDLENPGADLERVKTEMAKLKDSLRQIAESRLPQEG